MKKFLLLAALVLSINFSFAQKVSFGLGAGLIGSEMSTTYNGLYQANTFTSQRQETSNLTGYHFGGFVDISWKIFSIQPGISYTTKGGINDVYYSLGGYSYHSTEKLRLNYVEMPINFLVNLPVNTSKVFLGGGPYMDLGYSGKDENSLVQGNNGTTINSSVTNTVTFGSNPGSTNNYGVITASQINSPSYGLHALGGVGLNNGIFFSTGYDFALTKLSNKFNATAKLRGWDISAGFIFK